MQRFERGENVPPRENVSWLRRLDEKLRGIYAAVTCRRSSDVAIPRPAHRPPRPSLQRSEPRPSVHRSEPRPSQPGSSSWQQTPPSQPGSSSWQQPPPSQPGSSSWQQPPPSQPGSYIWHNQMELGNTTFYILFNILCRVYQLYMFYFTAVGSQSQPFMQSNVQSPMHSGGGGSFFAGDGDDDDRAGNTYEFSQRVLQTPQPPWTQET